MDLIAAEHGIDPSRSVVVGDRLDTDIRFGTESGMYSALVMTGVTTADKLKELREGTEEEPLPSVVFPHVGLLA
jgi:ribonucleotide monophosphatase NagD (HAD superfamily)